MTTHVLVLGAGFGGLEVTTRLADALGDSVRVTLIDRSDAFVFGFAKLDVMFGRRSMDDVRLPYDAIQRPNVEVRRETVIRIDPVAKRVDTDRGSYDADVLVVALGADLAPAATPGLAAYGHEFYSPEGAAGLTDVLEGFEGGDILIGVLGGFFKCPPAPYETALMLHDYLGRRGLRRRSSIRVVTPMPKPIPISAEVSAGILALLDMRKIEHEHGQKTVALEPGTALLQSGDTRAYDLFLGVPVHTAPPVVVDSGLTDDGWIAVDTATLATRWPDVYAVGDVTSAPVPRAGVIAEGEAAVVAGLILHRLGAGEHPAPFAGDITCYIEMGDDTVGVVDVNFLSGPAPTAVYTPPSADAAARKRAWAESRRQRWFGM